MELRSRVSKVEREKGELERQMRELEGVIERHQKELENPSLNPSKNKPAADVPERPNVVTPPSNVAH